MAINYPINLPAITGLRKIEFTSLSSVGLTRSPYTFAQQTQVFPGQLWIVEIELPRMTPEQSSEWESFILSLNGQQGTFVVGDPLKAEPRGTALGTPAVNGVSQTGNALITDGWDPDEFGLLLPGDHIELPGNRLHQVLNTVDSDSGGNATIDIWPNLRTSPTDDATIITVNPQGVFRLTDNNNVVRQLGPNRVLKGGFSGIEVV